jgi:hypothetical protein
VLPVAAPRAQELPSTAGHPPAPVIPLVVLIIAILAPCVAAAATRFARRR